MGAYEYGSFPFKIVKVEETPANDVKVTWTSRPGDTSFAWSTEATDSSIWWYEATVLSQGARDFWTGSTTAVPGRFYKVELKRSGVCIRLAVPKLRVTVLPHCLYQLSPQSRGDRRSREAECSGMDFWMIKCVLRRPKIGSPHREHLAPS